MSKSKFDQELKDRAVRMYHQELETESQERVWLFVCGGWFLRGVCRSGLGRRQSFG